MAHYKPVAYQASSPDAQLSGSILVGFTNNLRSEVILPIAKTYGFQTADPNKWYSAQEVLDFLRELETAFSYEELVAVGMKNGQDMVLPPTMNSIEGVLYGMDAIYKSFTRNIPPEEGVVVKPVGPKHVRLIFNAPVPAFNLYGGIYAMLQRVKYKGEDPHVYLIKRDVPAELEVKW